ncbi:hypothetical protein CF336_g2055 [Tilletia laevis]|nr:hypothetical protein CF336_g2055 [Tilletia laevis]
MANIRFLIFLPHLLLLATLGQSAPLPYPACPSCSDPPQPFSLSARSGPPAPALADSHLLEDIFRTHHADWERLKEEATRLHLANFYTMTPEVENRIRQLLAESEGSNEGITKVLAVMDELDNVWRF